MKASILYFSKTGTTKAKAEKIAEGMLCEGVEAKAISIEEIDENWIKESSCIIVGTPVYYTGTASKVEEFLEGLGKYNVAGKLGGGFATAAFSYGGGDLAVQEIHTRMLFWGMMVYSGGGACGRPPIHMGPVGTASPDAGDELFVTYGKRMAAQAKKIG